MQEPTPAQQANANQIANRFQHNIQGIDTESLFHLSSAPPLQVAKKTSEIIGEVVHFVPTRFEDKVNYMMAIERNRKAFMEERKRAKELLALGLASHDLRQSILGKPSPSDETAEQIKQRQAQESKEAQEENHIFQLYELHEDRRRYNQQFVDNYNANKFSKSHHFAKQYIEKCDPERDMETALRQNVITLRAMGADIGKKGRRCRLGVDEAGGNVHANDDPVSEPKILQKRVMPLIPVEGEAYWLEPEISPLSPTKQRTKRMKTKTNCYASKSTQPKITSKRQHRSTKHSKRTLQLDRNKLALNRRVVLHSFRKIGKLPAL